LGAQLDIFPMKSWGETPTYFFMGEIKVGHPTYLFAAEIKVVKTFMASNLLFILENKSWGYKLFNPKQIPKSCGPRQSQAIGSLFRIFSHQPPSDPILVGVSGVRKLIVIPIPSQGF